MNRNSQRMIVIDRTPGIPLSTAEEETYLETQRLTQPINFQGLIVVKDPTLKYVKPLTVPDNPTSFNQLSLPAVYKPECDRSVEEQNRLQFLFSGALKAVYKTWHDDRETKYVKVPEYDPSTGLWSRTKAFFSNKSKPYSGEELGSMDRIQWYNEMNQPYTREKHEIADSPEFELIQSLDNWQSTDLQDAVKLYKAQLETPSKDFPITLQTAFPYPQLVYTKKTIQDFIDEFLNSKQFSYNEQSKSWCVHWSVNWALNLPGNIISNVVPASQAEECPLDIREAIKDHNEAFLKKWEDEFNGKDQDVMVTNLLFIYDTIVNHVGQQKKTIKNEPDNPNFVLQSMLMNMARERRVAFELTDQWVRIPWYNFVQGRFQLQLLDYAYRFRAKNETYKKHFQIFSDYIFGTCH